MSVITPSADVHRSETGTSPLIDILKLGRGIFLLKFIAYEHCHGFASTDDLNEQFDDVRMLARRAVGVDAREQVHNLIESQRNAFWRSRNNEEWADTYLRWNEELRIARGDLPLEEARTALFEFIEQTVSAILNEICVLLDARGKSALHIGLLMERQRLNIHIAELETVSPPSLSWEELMRHQQQDDYIAFYFRRDPVAIASLRSWYRDIRTRWIELSLPSDAIPLLPTETAIGTNTGMSDFIHQLDVVFREAASNEAVPDTTMLQSRPGYLGLCCDDARRTVRRDGHAGESITLSRLLFSILRELMNSRGGNLGKIDLEACWGRLDLEIADWGTIDVQLSKLRQRLKPLGITISDGRHGLGVRLQERSIASQQDGVHSSPSTNSTVGSRIVACKCFWYLAF